MTDTSSVFPANITQLRGHNVIAVASGKGGVGKTWFSITLTHALTKLGRNALLFDGDLGLANVDIQLGLMPKRDLGAVVDGRYSLQAAA
jgi:flagellar biosynthesis protein FlhG